VAGRRDCTRQRLVAALRAGDRRALARALTALVLARGVAPEPALAA
jgi:hypothetical protein